jgi:glycine cleavage system H protein
MASLGFLVRTVARRSFDKVVRPSPFAQFVGCTRFSSVYYTPGTSKVASVTLVSTSFDCTHSSIFEAHEYIKVDGNVGTCGITDFAQSALGDIVFIDLPELDDSFEKGDSFGSVESVKAASDVYCPVGGTIVEINDKLSDEPGLVNTAAESDAWFIKIKIKDEKELESLLDAAAYKAHCDKE